MRVLIALSFIFLSLFANAKLESIEASIKEASIDFAIQKNENNVTKLLEISKILYENNQKLKELKSKYIKKISLEIKSKKALDKLQVEDIVELHVKTSHKSNEDYARADLSFFIYDGQNLLAKKDVELYEKGGLHKESLKFQITKPSQHYKVCAVFIEDAKEYKECKSFGVTQPLVVKSIIASTSLDAKTSDKTLLPNKDFYLFLPFENKTDLSLSGKVEISDSGKTIFSKNFIKEPAKGLKKAGVLVPASLIYEKQSLHVKISLRAEGINEVEKNKTINIAAFDWAVAFPKKLKSGENKKFAITPPKSFEKPLHVKVEPKGGVLLGHSLNALNGTVSAVTNKKENAYVTVSVKSASGESVKRRVYIALNSDFVEQVEKQADINKPVYQPKTTKKVIAIGTIKEFNCPESNDYVGKCKYKMTSNGWRVVDGEFRVNHRYDEKELGLYRDTYTKKGTLAMVGTYKNGKKDGKLTRYYGNGQVKSISYYQNGKRLRGNEKGYFVNGKLQYEKLNLGKNYISVTFTSNGDIYRFFEKIGSYALRSNDYLSKFSLSDKNSKKICEVEFRNKFISQVTCYSSDGKTKLGEKKVTSKDILTRFYSSSGSSCTNRVNYQGRLDRCKNKEEGNFLKRLDAFANVLRQSKENNRYLSAYKFDGLLPLIGESVYSVVYNSILTKELFVHSNISKNCKYLPNEVKRKFIDFKSKNKNKVSMYKNSLNSNYKNIRNMIMKEFAKMYYSRLKNANIGSGKCHNEIVRFYKEQGYLNAY